MSGLRTRPDTAIDKAEQIPLGGSLSLEVPEDPALDLGLEDVKLRADVIRVGAPLVVAPPFDEVDIRAGADIGRGGVRTV